VVLTSKQGVEEIIASMAKEHGIGRDEARTQLHKLVCRGRCEWYRTKSEQAGFDRSSLAEEQRERIRQIAGHVLRGLTEDEIRAEIHGILCPGAK